MMYVLWRRNDDDTFTRIATHDADDIDVATDDLLTTHTDCRDPVYDCPSDHYTIAYASMIEYHICRDDINPELD